MATIVQSVIGQIFETGLRLGNESWMRKAFFGRSWNRIRIGVIYSFTPFVTAENLKWSQLYVGLVGGNYPFLDPRCDMGVGIITNGQAGRDATSTLTYAASSYPYKSAYTNTTGLRGFQQHREYYVQYTGSPTHVSTTCDVSGGVQNFMTPLVVEFNRPQATLAGAWTVTGYYYSSAALAQAGYRQQHLSDALEQWLVAPTTNGQAMISTSAIFTIQTSEFGNEIDKICLTWTSSTNPVTIWAVGASMSYDQYPTYTGFNAATEVFNDYAYSGTLYSGANPSSTGTVEYGRWGFTGTGVISP